MYNHLRTTLIGHGAHLTEEVDQILAQLLGIDTLIAIKRLLKLLNGKALLRAGQAGNHIARKTFTLLVGHRLIASLGRSLLLGGIFRLGSRTTQDLEVKSHKGSTLEAQGT